MAAPCEPSAAIRTLSTPLVLPCGLVLPTRFVKCPMQETLALREEYFAPPIAKFEKLYGRWASSQYGLLITGQVQVDGRYLSQPGDVVVRPESLEEDLDKWKQWASIAQRGGTPCIVQIAHPGRMAAKGAGMGPAQEPIAPSIVPVVLGTSSLERHAIKSFLGTPRAATTQDIDEAVQAFLVGALVARKAGFAGVQIHAAHGFLVSQFLSPYTNRRDDDYGGSPEKRLVFLQRLVREIRAACPVPFCLSVKLNSGDYMKEGGLMPDEALEQVRWLLDCGLVDLIELSGGNAEGSQGSSRLAKSFRLRSMTAAPVLRESTRARESLFSDFAERVADLPNPRRVGIQLSGGFRSRLGMADSIDSGICHLVGLGRAAVLAPELCNMLLDPAVPDVDAFAESHVVRGLWIVRWLPVKVVGNSLLLGYFYYNMHRLGRGLEPDRLVSLPYLLWTKLSMPYRNRAYARFWRLFGYTLQ